MGAEYQPPNIPYRWNGLEREVPLHKRHIDFQWTIEGEGMLRVGSHNYPQTAGTAFAVQVPSDHEYRIVENGPGWKFFFIRIDDPGLTDQLCKTVEEIHWSFPLPSTTRLAMETLHYFQQAYGGELQDPFDADKATLDWVVELRRHIHHLIHPAKSRTEILESAQAFYHGNKTRSFGVEDFASSIGMTRTRASECFHKQTGKTLAAYFLELRLRDAVAMLGQGHKLQHIAQETGFADANHLCKSFKRIYHTTPGRFRSILGAEHRSEGI